MEIFDRPNALLEQENFFGEYQKKINDMRNDPHLIEWDKLCYELFEMNPQGKKFLEITKEKYLIPALARNGTATYQLDVMWAEGFKDFARMLISSTIAHGQRIKAGENRA